MRSTLQSIALGTNEPGHHLIPVLLLAVSVFVLTLAAYALGLFTISGGVIWIPFYAALVGMIAGFWVGYARKGLLFGWLVTYTALLGYHANNAFIGQSREPFTQQLRYFIRLDGLTYLAVVALILGTVVFILGFVVGRAITALDHRLAS